MKQTASRLAYILFLFTAACCLFVYTSCGLEVVVVVDEPTVTYNEPLYSNTDYSTYYCDFLTNETSSNNKELGDSFIGTEVYYKIYNSSSTLVSERSSILAVNTSSNGSSAATKMIETYTYQPLGSSPQNSGSVFVPQAGKNQRVYFRIVDNGEGEDLEADIRIDKASENRIPYRYSNDKSFDFFDNDDSDDTDKVDVEPESGDLDYKYSSTSSEIDEYYIQFFAVSVAYDTSSLTRSYSLVLNLGSIPVIKE